MLQRTLAGSVKAFLILWDVKNLIGNQQREAKKREAKILKEKVQFLHEEIHQKFKYTLLINPCA